MEIRKSSPYIQFVLFLHALSMYNTFYLKLHLKLHALNILNNYKYSKYADEINSIRAHRNAEMLWMWPPNDFILF